jgi:hypothetical protein
MKYFVINPNWYHQLNLGINSPVWRDATNNWAKKNLLESGWNMFLPAKLNLEQQSKADYRVAATRDTSDDHDYFHSTTTISGRTALGQKRIASLVR